LSINNLEKKHRKNYQPPLLHPLPRRGEEIFELPIRSYAKISLRRGLGGFPPPEIYLIDSNNVIAQISYGVARLKFFYAIINPGIFIFLMNQINGISKFLL
jgi:hypothetical protein